MARKIRFVQGALVRLEWSAIVEVPNDATEEELSDLEDRFYDLIDGGDYTDDPHYWERGQSSRREVMTDTAPTFVVGRDEAGTLEIHGEDEDGEQA